MTRLDDLTDWTFEVFNSLDKSLKYSIAFSGGKDSHVLLGLYFHWCQITENKLNANVVFSDTLLESTQLLKLIENINNSIEINHHNFLKVKPSLEKNFWVLLVGLGYPVPDYKNRWCTKYLKVEPMKANKGVVIAGSHKGESHTRDNRLNGCGSIECGIDKITNKIEPIAVWNNCDVWDWIIERGDTYLYQGVSDNLLKLYDIQESQSGSLRMGCFMCPVVAKARIDKQVTDGTIPEFSIKIRELIEQLRNAPRILSPKTKKAGAILVDSRIDFWGKLKKYFPAMLENKWIDEDVITLVDSLLARRAYPPTYKQSWIFDNELNAIKWQSK